MKRRFPSRTASRHHSMVAEISKHSGLKLEDDEGYEQNKPPSWYNQSLSRDVVVSELQIATLKRIELLSEGAEKAMVGIDGICTEQARAGTGSTNAATSVGKLGSDWDLATHLCLRLACSCASVRDQRHIRRWFIDCETALFHRRLSRWLDSDAACVEYSEHHHEWWRKFFGIKYQVAIIDSLPTEHREWLKSQQSQILEEYHDKQPTQGGKLPCATVVYYRVPVSEALSLVRCRALCLHEGYAFVPVAVPLKTTERESPASSFNMSAQCPARSHLMVRIVVERFHAQLASRVGTLGRGAAAGLAVKDERFRDMFRILLEAVAIDADPMGDQNEVVAFFPLSKRNRAHSRVGANKEPRLQENCEGRQHDDPNQNEENDELWDNPIEPLSARTMPEVVDRGHLPLCALRLYWTVSKERENCRSSSSSSSLFSASSFRASHGAINERETAGAGWLHYDQRRQLINFLKSCRVPVKDTLTIFRSAFNNAHEACTALGTSVDTSSSTMGISQPDQTIGRVSIRPKKRWDKYDYEIRYHYGHRGKREAAMTFTCGQLASDNFKPKPATIGGVGGCPFVNLTPKALKESLLASGLSANDAQILADAVDDRPHRGDSWYRSVDSDTKPPLKSTSSSLSFSSSINSLHLPNLDNLSPVRRATSLCRQHFDFLHLKLAYRGYFFAGSIERAPLGVPKLADILGLDKPLRSDGVGDAARARAQQQFGARILPVQWTAASIRLHQRMRWNHEVDINRSGSGLVNNNSSDGSDLEDDKEEVENSVLISEF